MNYLKVINDHINEMYKWKVIFFELLIFITKYKDEFSLTHGRFFFY